MSARVQTRTLPMWRLRMSLGFTRWLLYALAAAGLAATARIALAPPRAEIVREQATVGYGLAAAAYAQRFARAYLTWNGADAAVHQVALAPFLGLAQDPDAGVRPPPGASQSVLWTQLAGARALGGGETVYTVAAQTDRSGLVYLDVDVVAGPQSMRIGRYPAFVAGPAGARAGALDDGGAPAVADPQLTAVVTRALGNYLSGSRANLDADLAPGAEVATPSPALTLDGVSAIHALADGSVLALVDAHDAGGAAYTLAYQLALTRVGGRWELLSVDPGNGGVPP